MNLHLSEVDRQRGSVEKEQDPKVQRNSCRGFKKNHYNFTMFVSLFGQFLFVLLLVYNLCACLSSSCLFCVFKVLCSGRSLAGCQVAEKGVGEVDEKYQG